MENHICGSCSKGFSTEEAYLKHKCQKTGFKPTQAGHLGKDFEEVSKAALARGKARAK
jgi:hypothetical protein